MIETRHILCAVATFYESTIALFHVRAIVPVAA